MSVRCSWMSCRPRQNSPGPHPTDFLHFYHRHILTTDAECQVRLPGFKENTHDVNVVEFE
jgi:hypothetical protein